MTIRQILKTTAAAAATIVATISFAGAGTALALVAPPDPNRYDVEITNARSGLKADVMWASQTPGQPVFLWGDNNSASQEFDLLATGDGYFYIRARHSGQCLATNYHGNGGSVIQDPHCGRSLYNIPGGNEWRASWVGNNMTLVNRYSGRCLDADNGAGGAPPAWAHLQVWDCIHTTNDWNAGNQLWNIDPVLVYY